MELAEFLRQRRARLDPEALGLPPRARRRTPGLRREDVAERASLSVAWYTSLEQGRPVHPSLRVVTALADALALPLADREHLFTLTGYPAPTDQASGLDATLLQELVDRLDTPAYGTDALTAILAWNTGATAVFSDPDLFPDQGRNLLRLLFEEPRFGAHLLDRDDYAARVVRTFRGRSDAYLTNVDAIDLVEDLAAHNPGFERLWAEHDVRRADSDTLEVAHPLGHLTLTLVNLQAVATPGTRVSAYLPADEESAALLARL